MFQRKSNYNRTRLGLEDYYKNKVPFWERIKDKLVTGSRIFAEMRKEMISRGHFEEGLLSVGIGREVIKIEWGPALESLYQEIMLELQLSEYMPDEEKERVALLGIYDRLLTEFSFDDAAVESLIASYPKGTEISIDEFAKNRRVVCRQIAPIYALIVNKMIERGVFGSAGRIATQTRAVAFTQKDNKGLSHAWVRYKDANERPLIIDLSKMGTGSFSGVRGTIGTLNFLNNVGSEEFFPYVEPEDRVLDKLNYVDNKEPRLEDLREVINEIRELGNIPESILGWQVGGFTGSAARLENVFNIYGLEYTRLNINKELTDLFPEEIFTSQTSRDGLLDSWVDQLENAYALGRNWIRLEELFTSNPNLQYQLFSLLSYLRDSLIELGSFISNLTDQVSELTTTKQVMRYISREYLAVNEFGGYDEEFKLGEDLIRDTLFLLEREGFELQMQSDVNSIATLTWENQEFSISKSRPLSDILILSIKKDRSTNPNLGDISAFESLIKYQKRPLLLIKALTLLNKLDFD